MLTSKRSRFFEFYPVQEFIPYILVQRECTLWIQILKFINWYNYEIHENWHFYIVT